MKIEKYTKGKSGMYILTLEDGTKIKIHEDLILKYELLLKKEMDLDLFNTIQEENRVYEIYNIAVKYMNTRLRSRKELIEYLKKKEYDIDSIEKVIAILDKQGYLNDTIYAISFIHDKMLMSHDGPNKIRSELEKVGVLDEIITEKLSIFTEEIEKERIEKLVEKQIKMNHHKSGMMLKKKIQSYLLTLGYHSSYINDCLNHKTLVNPDIYQKEYQKQYQKLSKKYEGKELEYRLKQKLYQLGFSNTDFEE